MIAQFLLYFDAFFLLLGALFGGGLGLIGLVALAASVYGAYGIANELKRGYQVAVFASFLPLALRAIQVFFGNDPTLGIGYILFSANIVNVIFQYALIALLLHPMSRNHQKIWFS